MVYYHDDLGKRHDKSFGRGELGKAKAEAFEKAVQEANEKGPSGFSVGTRGQACLG